MEMVRGRDPRRSGIRSQREAARGDWPWRVEWARLGLDVLSVALHPRAIWPKRGTDLASATGVEPRWADVHAGAILMSIQGSAMMYVILEFLPHWGPASDSPRF